MFHTEKKETVMSDSENLNTKSQPCLQVYPLQKNGEFTETDAKINKQLVNPLVYPWLYNLHENIYF